MGGQQGHSAAVRNPAFRKAVRDEHAVIGHYFCQLLADSDLSLQSAHHIPDYEKVPVRAGPGDDEANSQASHVKQKAEEEIAQQKKQMLQDIRSEISGLAVDIASKVVEREINQKDYDGFVDEFIQNVGEQQ